jgi:predicted RNA binding protein YcfA (HicA-like mRNA interferase family)
MPATFDRELQRMLTRVGCYLVRSGKGSHEIWYSPITKRRFVLPAAIVSRHTANGVLKDAGLPKAF